MKKTLGFVVVVLAAGLSACGLAGPGAPMDGTTATASADHAMTFSYQPTCPARHICAV